MLLDLLRPLSFLAGILSLFPVLLSAFFVPGTHWEERLEMALLRVGFSAGICLLSGALYARQSDSSSGRRQSVLSTLPVRVFLWALAGLSILFALTWYLDTYYMPIASRNCCRF